MIAHPFAHKTGLPQRGSRLCAAVALGIAVAGLSLAEPATAHGYCRLTTEMPNPGNNCSQGGKGLAWRRQCISFSIDPPSEANPTLNDIRDVADRSFGTWNAVTCGGAPIGYKLAQTEELASCGQPQYNLHGPNANTIIFVDDWSARGLPQDAFGLTLVWHNPDTGEIYDADMQLNEGLGTITICGATCRPGSDAVDLQNVVTHEAGHFLGLGHSAVLNATMSARASIGETSKRVLAEDDIQGICSVYGSQAAPACQDADFVPNHGFTAACLPAESTGTRTGCSIARAGSRSPAGGGGRALWLGLAAALGVLRYLRRRLRPRSGRSSARPSPTNT